MASLAPYSESVDSLKLKGNGLHSERACTAATQSGAFRPPLLLPCGTRPWVAVFVSCKNDTLAPPSGLCTRRSASPPVGLRRVGDWGCRVQAVKEGRPF